MKKYLILLLPIVIAGCQVTGEKNNLYQRALGGVGPKIKTLPLVSSENEWQIKVPISIYNAQKPLKGLVGINNIADSFTDFNLNVDHYFYSTLRPLSESTAKLNFCHAMSQKYLYDLRSSRSCSDILLRFNVSSFNGGKSIKFNAREIIVSTDNYGFFMKNDAPNILKFDGTLKIGTVVSQFAYTDLFSSSINRSVFSFNDYYKRFPKDGNGNRFVEQHFSLDLNDAHAKVKCNIFVDLQKEKPTSSCSYMIYGEHEIYDYRPYNVDIIHKLNKYVKEI